MATNKHRYIWIDWMKVIGLYFIILGHFLPPYKSYIYAFNVPVFFIISGFLTKKESDIKIFFNKIMHNLIIPAIIILIINFIWDLSTDTTIKLIDFPKRLFNVIIGMHGINQKGGGLETLWYVYTLIILKIIYQICSRRIQQLLLVILPIIAIYLNYRNISLGNAIINATVSYPFWYIGLLLRQNIEHLEKEFSSWYKMNLLLLPCIIILYITGHYNNSPWMYINEYGNYFLLFIIGGTAGSYIIYYISKKTEKYIHKTKYLNLLSSGSIIILGLHYIFIDIFRLYDEDGCGFKPITYSFIIILLFIPINILS